MRHIARILFRCELEDAASARRDAAFERRNRAVQLAFESAEPEPPGTRARSASAHSGSAFGDADDGAFGDAGEENSDLELMTEVEN